MYENSGFWRRFICNLFDFLISAVVIFVIFYFLIPTKENFYNNTYYYGSFSLCILWIMIYFILVPIIFNKQTLFQKLFNLKTLDQSGKKINFKTFIIKNLFNGAFWIVILVLFISLIKLSDFNNQDLTNLKSGFWNDIKKNLIAILISYWFLLQFIANISIILNKSRLSIIDKITHTRVVINKYKNIIKNEELKLIPYYSELPHFEYFNDHEREEHEFKEK
ncbi:MULTISPECIES: RDD family protein [unclassified Mycoplasma]|uniref:RDD family protein n=1 Tax=unclassified Mycoplasma TaxID=2683645 RepID=UPI00211BB225|nr:MULTISPECIES: RDD family protein [unclassified Mycoplasma]UUM19587.1 RDD family protein [Mycoplasma sp. 1578d]UUM24507.1 RDD family protein [Mycoplasma sp. 3686d]